MNVNVAYEIVDLRKDVSLLPRIGAIQQTAGGLVVYGTGILPLKLTWDDDALGTFTDNETTGEIFVVTSAGEVVFKRLGLDNWADLEPFYPKGLPAFETDDAVNEYFYTRIMKGP